MDGDGPRPQLGQDFQGNGGAVDEDAPGLVAVDLALEDQQLVVRFHAALFEEGAHPGRDVAEDPLHGEGGLAVADEVGVGAVPGQQFEGVHDDGFPRGRFLRSEG
jgi:hypothetical protein